MIEPQVAEGEAASPSAFLEEAVKRLVDEARSEEDELLRAVEAGSADIEAARYTTVATAEDERHRHHGMMARQQARLSASAWSVYRLAGTAEARLDALLLDSARVHSLEAAGRHGPLILTVMAALGNDPPRPGLIEVSRLQGIHACPPRLRRRRVEAARRAGTLRHRVV